MSLEDAVRVMELVGRQGLDLDTALRQSRLGTKTIDKTANKLGLLMSASGIISPYHLTEGLIASLNTGLPLGMVLVEKNVVTPETLEWCLIAQSMLNEKTLTFEEAAQALQSARFAGCSFEHALKAQGFKADVPQHTFATAELLVLANVITETQLLAAREIGLERRASIDETLIKSGLVPERIVSASKQLVDLIKDGTIAIGQAASLVRRLCHCQTVEEMVDILGNLDDQVDEDADAIQLLDLIGMCQLVTPEQLVEALKLSRKTRKSLLETMLTEGILTEAAIAAANECQELLHSGVLEINQAIIALAYAIENETGFWDAIIHFGWCKQLALV
jgi:hypothetical protein